MKIRVSYGKTFNLGNYETERIDLATEEEIDSIGKNDLDNLIENRYAYLKAKINYLHENK